MMRRRVWGVALVAMSFVAVVANPAKAQDPITIAPAWGTAQGGPSGNPSRDADAGLVPDLAWQRSVADNVTQRVVAADGRVFAETFSGGGGTGNLTAFDIVDGSQLW